MTYCVGVLLEQGLIFASDSRTHAGVDNFASFCKMTVFERTHEIGILLAVGWKRRRIVYMVLCESALLGLFGGQRGGRAVGAHRCAGTSSRSTATRST